MENLVKTENTEKIEILSKQGCTVSFSVEVPKESMQNDEVKIIAEYMMHAKINGYRPGKAPKEIILRLYHKDIRKDMLQKNLKNICNNAISSLSLYPLSDVQVENLHYDLFTPLSMTVTVEVSPEFSLSDYKNMTLYRHPTDVSDEEVMSEIKKYAEEETPFQNVQDRGVQKNDFVTVDFELFDDTNQSFGKKTDTRFHLTDDFPVLDISIGLMELKIGEEKDIEVQFPDNYMDKAIAGKKLKHHLKVKEIRIKQVPEITEDYIKVLDHGIYSNLDEYKLKVSCYLKKCNEKLEEDRLHNQILQQLSSLHSFELPSNLLKMQANENYKRYLQNLSSSKLDHKIPESWIKENQEKIFKRSFDEAVSQLKLEFIFTKIIETEKIKSTQEELEQALNKEATEYKFSKEQYRNFLLSKNSLDAFYRQVDIKKVNLLILSHAKFELHEKHEHGSH